MKTLESDWIEFEFTHSLLLAVCAQSLSCVLTLVTPWTVARQAPLSMGFPRQEYWRGLSFPPPGDLSSLGIQLMSPACPALAGRLSTTKPPGKFYQNFKPLWPSISWSLSGGWGNYPRVIQMINFNRALTNLAYIKSISSFRVNFFSYKLAWIIF